MAEHAQHHGVVGQQSPDDQYLETPPGSTYEHTDAHVGPMVKFALWLLLSAVIVHVGLAAMYWVLIRESTEKVESEQYPLRVSAPPRLPAAPRLQQFPRNELYDFRVKEEQQLHSYGWVDKNAGTVHIPIDDAMRLVLERGVLTSRPADTSQPAEPVDVFPSDSSSGRVMEKRRQ
ncbi:MAG: hypothetical protein DMF88_20950 [Acidobacteria bacterium]|nr:MAG: hypothetical protein DMF88_20950 [Acidobacteriota bacterium]